MSQKVIILINYAKKCKQFMHENKTVLIIYAKKPQKLITIITIYANHVSRQLGRSSCLVFFHFAKSANYVVGGNV
jgi:hypothetical protein